MGGVAIKPSGSGTGSDGGFDIGDHLAFTGDTYYNVRWAALTPVDSTAIDTITITAIRGNDSNGGEDPDVFGQEELFLIYKTPDMSRSSYISQDRNNNNVGAFPADAAIIAINQGDGTLQDYTITIPEYARQKDVVFGLIQLSNSGTQYEHYGVTDIKPTPGAMMPEEQTKVLADYDIDAVKGEGIGLTNPTDAIYKIVNKLTFYLKGSFLMIPFY